MTPYINKLLEKEQWRRDLRMRGYERDQMTPNLAEALRTEIRTALDADGKPFDTNIARRVYDLAIAARDMCIAASSSVKEAIGQIKETNGPMESQDTDDTPESQVQASETFGARLIREVLAVIPMMNGQNKPADPKALVHALALARQHGMHDVAEELEVKLFGRVLSGDRPITPVIDVVEGSFEHGFADGKANELPAFDDGDYKAGYLKGTEARFMGTVPVLVPVSNDHSAAIEQDIRLGQSSEDIRDEIIAKVGMMGDARTPEMQARFDAAVARERTNGVTP